jgi:hypothetical protein
MMTIEERAVRQPRKVDFQLGLRRAMMAIEDQGVAEDPRATPEAIAPERLRLADAGILHLSPIVGQLVELWKGPKEDDYGLLRPTRDAFDNTVHLLLDAAINVYPRQRQIPFGCVSTDSEGGVRIEWVRPTVSLHLVVPAQGNRPAYIYHRIGSDHATENVTPALLTHWLHQIE